MVAELAGIGGNSYVGTGGRAGQEGSGELWDARCASGSNCRIASMAERVGATAGVA